MTTGSDYPACIAELYESEVFGEAAFLALLKAAKNPREKYHFATFLQLETETKARLRPLLLKYDFTLEEGMDPEQINGIVAAYQGASWADFLGGMKPMIDNFLQRFTQIAALGPDEDRVILESMIKHEMSFVHWIDKELAGEEGSLDAVLEIIQYRLSRPDSAWKQNEKTV
jgi:hypothetical protein